MKNHRQRRRFQMRKTASFRTWLENPSLSHGDISTDDILVVFFQWSRVSPWLRESRAIECLWWINMINPIPLARFLAVNSQIFWEKAHNYTYHLSCPHVTFAIDAKTLRDTYMYVIYIYIYTYVVYELNTWSLKKPLIKELLRLGSPATVDDWRHVFWPFW